MKNILAVFLFTVALGVALPVQAAALSESQIQAILGLLSAFGAEQSVISNVNSALRGVPVSTSPIPSSPATTVSPTPNWQIVQWPTAPLPSPSNAGPATSVGTQNTLPPIISSVFPNSAQPGTTVTIWGSNLANIDSVVLYNFNGQEVGATYGPLTLSEASVKFVLSGLLVGNTGAGEYQIGVYKNNCKGGCESNWLRFTVRE